MSRLKIFDDEIIAKRIFTKIENASKLPLNYINKHKDNYNKDFKSGKFINKNMFRKNTEVVVKITSGSKHFQALSKHLDYISREGKLELITSDFDVYLGDKEKLKLKKIFKNEGAPIPQYGKEKKERRHTINMVFSMKEHSTTPADKLQKATITALKRMYPNNFFVVAFHNDTDNPHCHVCLKVADKNGKRINPKKSDLANLRTEFAKALNELGVEAKATNKKQKEVEINTEHSLKDKQSHQKTKMHYYQVVDFGKAHYNFNKNAKPSYFVKYRTKKGITTIWSEDLERVINENKVLRGEYAKFKIVGKQEFQLTRKAKIDGEWQEIAKTYQKSIWDVSVIGREKELKSLDKKLDKDLPKYQIVRNKEQETNLKGEKDERSYKQIYRQRVLQELGNNATIPRGFTRERNTMRVLSKESLVQDAKRTQMLLHINALNQLQQGNTKRPDNILRWTDSGFDRVE